MFRQRTPVILQSEAPECGIACLAMIASHHGLHTDLSAMRLRLAPSMKGVSFKHLAGIAESMGLASRGVKVPLDKLAGLKLPAVLHWDMNHFVVLTHADGKRLTLHDPARGRVTLSLAQASDHYTGVAMEFWPAPGFKRADEREKVSAWQLLGAASGTRGAIVQVLLLSGVLEILSIALPFFLQIVVDRVVISRDRDLLTVLGVGFGGLALAIAAITALRGWLGVYISTRVNLQMLDTLFARLTRLPLAWFEKRNIGDIVSRFRSVDAIQRTLTLTFLETVMDGAMVLLTLAVMVFYSAELTAVVLAAALLYAVARLAFYGALRRATDERLTHEARAATHFIETLRGMMAIKLNLRETERRAAYLNHVVAQTNAEVRVQALAIVQRGANLAIFGLENVVVIWLGALLVLDGQFSVGMLFAFMGFKLLFITRIAALVDKGIEFRMLDLHAERVADIALAEPEPAAAALGAAESGPFEIRGENLAYSYGVEGEVFRGIDFQVKPGEVVAIVGPSGSGKTTLIKVLTGLFAPTGGRLSANGRDAAEWDRGEWRSRIGVVMQEDQLFVGTLEDNIAFFDPAHDAARVREAARLAGIAEDIEALPMGYNTLVGSLGVALSGGQRVRVMLARALYRQPQILFLDETFDQLDLAREQGITAGLRARGLGLVIVSHRPETVRAVDRHVVLGATRAPAKPELAQVA